MAMVGPLASALLDGVVSAARWAVGFLLNRVPGPPSREAAAPDVDGRRSQTSDTTAAELERLRKDGHGGYR